MVNYMTAYNNLPIYPSYIEGATSSVAGKPLYDGKIDKVDRHSAKKIREQTKYLNVNNTDVPAIIAKATARTIGVNVNIKVKSPNDTFNAQAEKFLNKFSKLNVGELTGKHHMNSAYRAISDFDLLDGGLMVRHHYNSAWTIPYKYELVPMDMLDTNQHSAIKTDEPYTLNGIVYNEFNQITHLYLYIDDDKRTSKKVSVDNLTYYSDVWVNIGQQIAISKLASLLPTIDQLNTYQKAELDNAIESAKSGAYLKSSAYNEIMLVLREAIEQMAGSKTTKEKLDTAYDYAKPILDRLASIGVKPYGLTPIPSEDEVTFDTRKRDGVYDSLNNKAEMKMGASIGMSDLGIYSKADKVNYSAMKYVSETDQLSADIRFDNLSAKIFDEINARAIEVGVQTGAIGERVKYWLNQDEFHVFRYLRQIHIDIEPSKNAQANKTNIETGVDTEADIVERREGIDYQDWLNKRNDNIKAKIKKDLDLEKYENDLRETMNLPKENINDENGNITDNKKDDK